MRAEVFVEDSMHTKNILDVVVPEEMYPNDLGEALNIRNLLLKEWHPDYCSKPEAKKTTDHILEMYRLAVDKINNGTWAEPNTLSVPFTIGGKTSRIVVKYDEKRATELGEVFWGKTVLTYRTYKSNLDLHDRYVKVISALKYANADMKAKISVLMPNVKKLAISGDGNFIFLNKTLDIVPLKETLSKFGGALPPEHTSWIISKLLNLQCFFAYNGVSHPFRVADLWISPEHHTVLPLGGFFFAAAAGQKALAVPAELKGLSPAQSIRRTGRELLGAASGMGLKGPPALVEFLRSAPANDAVTDYKYWQDVVLPKMGPRKFVKMEVPS